MCATIQCAVSSCVRCMPRRRSAGLQVRAEWDSLLRALQDRTATIASLEENFSEMKIEQVRNSFVRVSAVFGARDSNNGSVLLSDRVYGGDGTVPSSIASSNGPAARMHRQLACSSLHSGFGKPSPGADVAGVSPVLLQMGHACRCKRSSL